MVSYIFEAEKAFQVENDAGMEDRAECVVKYDSANRCARASRNLSGSFQI